MVISLPLLQATGPLLLLPAQSLLTDGEAGDTGQHEHSALDRGVEKGVGVQGGGGISSPFPRAP